VLGYVRRSASIGFSVMPDYELRFLDTIHCQGIGAQTTFPQQGVPELGAMETTF
jgi:hypothetical protein